MEKSVAMYKKVTGKSVQVSIDPEVSLPSDLWALSVLYFCHALLDCDFSSPLDLHRSELIYFAPDSESNSVSHSAEIF